MFMTVSIPPADLADIKQAFKGLKLSNARELKRVSILTDTDTPVVVLQGDREKIIPLMRELLSKYRVLRRDISTYALEDWQTMEEYLATADLPVVKAFLHETISTHPTGIEGLLEKNAPQPIQAAMLRYATLAPSKHAVLYNAADATRTLRQAALSILAD